MKGVLGNYYNADSLLHRTDPRLKFLAALFFMILLFALKSFSGIGAYAAFVIVLCIISKVPVKIILRSLKSILFIGLIAFLLNCFIADGKILFQIGFLKMTYEGLMLGARTLIRLILLILISQLLLTLSTTAMKIADALESLLSPFSKIGFPSHEIAMMMSIALRFVPTLIDESDKLMKAQSSRGADYDTGTAVNRIRGLMSILIPLFVSSFKRADQLAMAMEARSYTGGKGRTKLHPLKYSTKDGKLLIFFVAAALLIIAADIFLPEFLRGILQR